jgi:hypothetical protein
MSDLDLRDKYTKLQKPAEGVNGALPIDGLASSMVIWTAGDGLYSGDIYGYRVVAAGSANWTLRGKDDGAAISVPTTGFVAGTTIWEHLDQLTIGTGGSAVLYL